MIIESEYLEIVEQLGLDSRFNKLKEELGETLVAVCHFQDKKVKIGDVLEEVADVMLPFS